MKINIIIFPGSNCDRDIQISLKRIKGNNVEMIWYKNNNIPKSDLIVLPGGFSYGDYLRSGAIAAKSNIMKSIISENNKGTPILGICNGFQILTEAGLLPGTLMHNINLKFICKNVYLRIENNKTIFTKKYNNNKIINLPIAHRNGRYYADNKTLDIIESNEQIAFRYSTKDGEINKNINFNGSKNNIAGIFNKNKNILGMMPHPERSDELLLGGVDGTYLFNSIIESFA